MILFSCFIQMTIRIPEARLLLERYISMIKIVTDNLNNELEWTLKKVEEFISESTDNEASIENLTVRLTFKSLKK